MNRKLIQKKETDILKKTRTKLANGVFRTYSRIKTQVTKMCEPIRDRDLEPSLTLELT